MDVYPKPKPVVAPEHLPDNVHRYYMQAADSVRRQSFDAGGVMCRKAIDAAIRETGGDSKETLERRIDALAASQAITPTMRDWAHEVRLGGNEAAHEETPFDGDQAQELLSFTEMFLIYLFTLPEMLAARRRKRR